MRKIVVLMVLALEAGLVFSQSRSVLIKYADEAFKKQQYSTAADLYLKILNYVNDDEERFFPYEIRSIDIPKKQKKSEDTSASQQTLDTLKRDSVNSVKKDTTASDTLGKNMVVNIRDQYVVHQLAEAYRLNHDYLNAEKWFGTSALSNPRAYPEERYWYGVCLMMNGKYEAALEQFEKFKELKPSSKPEFYTLADKKISGCYLGMDRRSVDSTVSISELDSLVNGGLSSFAPVFYGDKNTLAFANGRVQLFADEKQEVMTADIYTVERSGDSWNRPVKMGLSVNTSMNEQPGAFTPDKQRMFFSRWTVNEEGKREHAIYMSRYLNGQWLQPQKLGPNVNMEGYQSMNPTLNLDGSVMFFASDRPGGMGKSDIWKCTIDEFGNAGTAVNLGASINTPDDEVTPYFDYLSHILYFSSAGHPGLGGLDIFKSYGDDEDSLWTTPINLKGPINSSRDDAYFAVYKDNTVSYFASDRKLCENCETGACFKIYTIDQGPMIITLKGTVYNRTTNQPLPNSLITLKDVSGDIHNAFFITDENGNYSTVLREEVNYYIKSQKSKFFGDQATVNTMGITKTTNLIQDFYLDAIPSGDIVIPGIEYDFDKATLRPRSKLILDTLADKLKLNDNLVVEISSHTDSRGNDNYNLKLSQDRAKSVVDYLISKGIEPERLLPQGYGETKLLVTDAEINAFRSEEEKEAGHQKNRRTAFKILKETELKGQ